MAKPKILLLDIETSPIVSYTWGLFDQNVAINQIKEDWSVLSFAAKWLDKSKVIYEDQRNAKKVRDDKKLLKRVWKLLDQADIVIGHNSIAFDTKKLNARFLLNNMLPPSPYKNIDTYRIAKGRFNLTSNKLEYLSSVLCPEMKKSDHKKYPGFSLWSECLEGNKEAWAEMKRYNVQDVYALEAVYNKLKVWDSFVNISLDGSGCRSCGSYNLQRRGFEYTSAGKQQRFQCMDCGGWCKSGVNLLSKDESREVKRRV